MNNELLGNQVGYGIEFEAIVNKKELVLHIDKCSHFYFLCCSIIHKTYTL